MADTDFRIYDRNGRLVAVADVKARPETSKDWASVVRDEIIERDPDAAGKFVLLVARDRLYVWRPGEQEPTVIASEDVLGNYVAAIRSGLDHVSPGALEMLTGIWLADLARDRVRRGPVTDEISEELERSGFVAAIRNGRVEILAAA